MKNFAEGIFLIIIGLGIIFFTKNFSDSWNAEETSYLVCIPEHNDKNKKLSIKLNVKSKSWIILNEDTLTFDGEELKPVLTEDELIVNDTTIFLDKENEVYQWECLDCGPTITKESWNLDRVTLEMSYTIEINNQRITTTYQCEKVDPL